MVEFSYVIQIAIDYQKNAEKPCVAICPIVWAILSLTFILDYSEYLDKQYWSWYWIKT